MRTVLLPMYPTDGPMARVARGGVPGNSIGQIPTSTSTLTHVWGAYGAPTLCRRRAADGRRSLLRTSFGTPMSVFHAVLSGGRTQHHPLSAANAKNRVVKAHGGPKRRLCTCAHRNSTICNTNVPYTHATSQVDDWTLEREDMAGFEDR